MRCGFNFPWRDFYDKRQTWLLLTSARNFRSLSRRLLNAGTTTAHRSVLTISPPTPLLSPFPDASGKMNISFLLPLLNETRVQQQTPQRDRIFSFSIMTCLVCGQEMSVTRVETVMTSLPVTMSQTMVYEISTSQGIVIQHSVSFKGCLFITDTKR
ncbi:hypothetical protein ElyMa_004189500 [Elysia marginata]|uniref:Uncharacterized protein n=1 Tax=Elysia marginata TaxID=1093978 RepID=A0AAV4GJY8_9GAST|nr:hypothetical protein ElyMa_004189500 [Elysia marginata]